MPVTEETRKKETDTFMKAQGSKQHSRLELEKKHEELTSLFNIVQTAKKEWEKAMDCVDDIVVLIDDTGVIQRCNKTLIEFVKKPYNEILGENLQELLARNELTKKEFISAEKGTEYYHAPSSRTFIQTSFDIIDEGEELFSKSVLTFHDITARKKIARELAKKNKILSKAIEKLKASQSQLLQQEKMASIGQLAAGVAHEINNPVGFVTSNLSSLEKYAKRLTEFSKVQSNILTKLKDVSVAEELKAQRKKLKIDFILEDIKDLVSESLNGVDRVKKIVSNLKNFSRVDQAEHLCTDINECIDETLEIVWNELKYKTTVTKDYGKLPQTKCYPQQLNQVFMNLLVNAAQSIEKQGEITIKTWAENDSIFITISDTGSGIPKENLTRLFEPFFTTKEVGKGTGLGLSIVYDIITKKHAGEITVESEEGKGTTFTIQLPVVAEDNT